MKKTLKSTLATLSVAILTALSISSCETKGDHSNGGSHTMGGKTNTWPMSNADMPGMR